MKQRMACLLIGILMGAVLLGGNTSQAAESFFKAFPGSHTFYLDGQPIEMEAYNINGNNYVMLRDFGKALGFNVYWSDGVHIDTNSPYTGSAPSDITVGSYKGTSLQVGERSALIIRSAGSGYSVVSSDPSVLSVEQVSGSWVIEGKAPGSAVLTITTPSGAQGTLSITVRAGDSAGSSTEGVSSSELLKNMEIREEIISLVNQIRREHGVQELSADQSLMDTAQVCASRWYTWHHPKEECQLALDYGYPHGFGANLTVFTGTSAADAARTAVDNWAASPGHFRSMIDARGDSIGVGVERQDGVTYCYLFVGMPGTHNAYE